MSEFSQTLSGVLRVPYWGKRYSYFSVTTCLCLSNIAQLISLHISSKFKIEIESKLESDGFETGAWSKRNKFPINYGKSITMAVGTRQKLNNIEALHITTEDCQIMPVKLQKLLGVYIDEHLNWTPHIDHLCATISSRISLLKQLAQYVSENIQKTFYQGYILPLIDSGSNTWGATSNTNVERLNKLQKRAARIILNADNMTPSADKFKSLDWMSVNNRLKYKKAVITYKAINGLTPSNIADLPKPIAKHVTELQGRLKPAL